MAYNLDKYITEATERGILVRFPETDNIESYEEQFENLIQWDIRNNYNSLIVYEHNHNPIAFYDVNTLEGFILAPYTIEHKT